MVEGCGRTRALGDLLIRYGVMVIRFSIWRKCSSWVQTAKPCCMAEAAFERRALPDVDLDAVSLLDESTHNY